MAIPSQAIRALTTTRLPIEYLTTRADYARLPIPIQRGWALAQVAGVVQVLSPGACYHAGSPIPHSIFTTENAYVFIGEDGCGWAFIDTIAIVVEWVPHALIALVTHEEYVHETIVLDISAKIAKVELECEAIPHGLEFQRTMFVVDSESRYAVQPSIVAADGHEWRVSYISISIIVGVIYIAANLILKFSVLYGHIADVDWVYLRLRGDSNCDCYARHIRRCLH